MNFIDIHCHPSMKIHLFNRYIHKEFHPKGKNLSTNMFVNLPSMRQGGVNAAVSVHYLPESDLTSGIFKTFVKGFLEFIEHLLIVLVSFKFEDRSSPRAPFYQMAKIILKFEENIKIANQKEGNNNTVIAKNYAEFENAISEGKIVFIHSIEGGNCLGHGITDANIILEEIQTFFEIGVCQFTIAHFFQNVLVTSQGGMPPHIKKLLKYDAGNTYPNGYNETNDIAKIAIVKMLDLGIIIDLVHCTNETRNLIFDLNNERGSKKRPIIFSHTGIREIVLRHNPNFPLSDQLYLPNAEDILKVKDCGGVLGIIFMDYWLKGREETTPALEIIIETIHFIHQICGNSYENIAIGSDLDGFTQVPADLLGANFMDELVAKMRTANIPESGIEAICF
ncbi:MAG: membrane dipeptidase, partial [Cytophagales bacterium]